MQSRARSLEQAAAVSGVARAHHGRDERAWPQRGRAREVRGRARMRWGRCARVGRCVRVGGLQQALCDASYLRSRRCRSAPEGPGPRTRGRPIRSAMQGATAEKEAKAENKGCGVAGSRRACLPTSCKPAVSRSRPGLGRLGPFSDELLPAAAAISSALPCAILLVAAAGGSLCSSHPWCSSTGGSVAASAVSRRAQAGGLP